MVIVLNAWSAGTSWKTWAGLRGVRSWARQNGSAEVDETHLIVAE